MELFELYICHYCFDYTSNSRSDMRKHFMRKNKCNCFTTISYEESRILTMNKLFLFSFSPVNLTKTDYSFICTHSNNKKNIINKNFYKEIQKSGSSSLQSSNKNNETKPKSEDPKQIVKKALPRKSLNTSQSTNITSSLFEDKQKIREESVQNMDIKYLLKSAFDKSNIDSSSPGLEDSIEKSSLLSNYSINDLLSQFTNKKIPPSMEFLKSGFSEDKSKEDNEYMMYNQLQRDNILQSPWLTKDYHNMLKVAGSGHLNWDSSDSANVLPMNISCQPSLFDFNESIHDLESSDNECNDDKYSEDEEEEKADHMEEKEMDEFNKLYFNKEKNKFICDKCDSEYTQKFNLVKHMKNTKSCEYKQTLNGLIQKSKEFAKIKKEREDRENQKFQQHLVQNVGTQNIHNIGTQNINNINNNNTQNNNYNLSLRDFVHDNYDLTHIKDSFYQNKDFFTYPNFLRMIMENEKNRNIFFANNEAIIYSDNELNRMSSDKAGYLVLDKLSQSFDQLLYRQTDDTRKYYNYVTKYYHVIKGHYKHDTIFKDYNVQEQRFIYTASSNMFRSRDKYLSKIVSTINKFSSDIRENMNMGGYQIKDIPFINPSIEDFASAKMRYRDLKD